MSSKSLKSKTVPSKTPQLNKQTPIAVVATGALFAQSAGPAPFWQNIVNGKDLFSEVPPTHWLLEDYYDDDRSKPGKINTRRGSFISAIPFDPMEFGIPPNTISATDSAQMMALIVAQQLLAETRSVKEGKLSKDKISVILGAAGPTGLITEMCGQLGWPHWEEGMRKEGLADSQIASIKQKIMETYPKWTEDTFPGCLGNVIAGRIANRLDLKGTNCIVDAACAGGLAAIKMAMMELETGEADLVITGGVDALNDPFMFSCFSKTGALSKSGDCRPFSDKADGTMLGEGIGLFALRRLSDAERDGDQIYAVIRAIGSASDGKGMSVYAPMAAGQELTLKRAYEKAGYSTNDVGLIEAHGTGTAVGDQVEFQALRKVFNQNSPHKKQTCALGSVKSQVGHAKAAAGAAGLFKAVMSLHHKVLPGTIKIEQPNGKMDFQNSSFYLNTQSKPWIHGTTSSRKAGVSAFGFGGTDFHVAVEEYRGANQPLKYYSGEDHLLLISGQSSIELLATADSLVDQLDKASLMHVARSSQTRFSAKHKHRLAILAKDKDEAKKKIAQHVQRIKESDTAPYSVSMEAYYGIGEGFPKIGLLFAGQGSQYCGMGKDLAMTFDVCREVWDKAADLSFDTETKLHEIVFPISTFDNASKQGQEAKLRETQWAQPAIGAVALSQLALLKKLGIDCQCTAGHSSGEVLALFAAGILSKDVETLSILRKRGELMRQAAKLPGAMTAVFAPADKVLALIDQWKSSITIANYNSPKQQVISGLESDIDSFETKLEEENIRFVRLPVASAFHSIHVQESVKPFGEFLEGVAVSGAKIPVYANTTAKLYPKGHKPIKELLSNQLAMSVKFQDIIEAMYESGVRVFVELGPQSILTGLVQHCLEGKTHTAVSLDQKGKSGLLSLWNAIGTLAASGVDLHYAAIWEGIAQDSNSESAKRSPATIQLTGSLYGKPYPPVGGKKGAEPYIANKSIQEKGAPAMAQSESPQHLRKFGPPPSFGEVKVNSNNAPRYEEQPQDRPVRNHSHAQLQVLQSLQASALAAQKQFQQALTESHRAYLNIVKTALQEISHLSGASDSYDDEVLSPDFLAEIEALEGPEETFFQPIPEAPKKASQTQKAAPRAPHIAPPSYGQQRAHSVPKPTIQQPRPPVAPTAVVQPKITAAKVDFREVLFDAIAENTGYPKEMLELDTELEAGLGIDSIKRVEILSAVQEKIPNLTGQGVTKMTQMKTLRAILEFVEAAQGSADTKK